MTVLTDIKFDFGPMLQAFKDFCLWTADQMGVEIRWVILAVVVVVVIHWFTRDRGRG